jgi:putative tricarboxylic transport membrane protein
MHWKDRFSGLCLIFFSGVTIYLALRLPLGRIGKPGPALFPLLLSIMIGFLAFLLLLRTFRSKGESEIGELATAKWKLLYLLGALCLFAFLFRRAGFLISTCIFLVSLKPIVKKKWIPVLLGSLVISMSFFFFFNYLLKVELPMGILAK